MFLHSVFPCPVLPHTVGSLPSARQLSLRRVGAVLPWLAADHSGVAVRLGERRDFGGHAARARPEMGLASASASNSWPGPEPSLPLMTAQRTWSRRSAPRRDQRICCALFMRRLTRKLAVPSVIDVPTR